MSNDITLSYDKWGRLQYHPDIHVNHGMPWLASDNQYLIEHYNTAGPEEMSIELGRTIHTIMQRVCELRKQGLMDKPNKRVNKKRSLTPKAAMNDGHI